MMIIYTFYMDAARVLCGGEGAKLIAPAFAKVLRVVLPALLGFVAP